MVAWEAILALGDLASKFCFHLFSSLNYSLYQKHLGKLRSRFRILIWWQISEWIIDDRFIPAQFSSSLITSAGGHNTGVATFTNSMYSNQLVFEISSQSLHPDSSAFSLLRSVVVFLSIVQLF